MENFMAGVARFSIRFRYAIIGGWLVAAALCVTLLPSLASAINTDNSSFLPASAPSRQAMDLADPFQPAGTTTAVLVVAGKSTLTTSDQNAITSLEGKIAKDNHVVSVSDQGLSKDGEASKAQVVVNVLTSSTDASPTVAAIRATISSGGLPSGVTGYLTGQLPTAVDNQNSQASAQRLTEQLSALVILVMLAVVYRSVLAPLVTLGTAELVLQMTSRIIAEMSTAGLQVSTVTQTMLVVLLLGAGTDYGLFLVLRVREEMAGGAAPHAAIERAGRYIGESITFSAGTVIVALLCLLLASFGLYSGLGPALALGVAVATAAHHTGTTVTSAGLILAATFGTAAITGATSQIKQLSTAIALGVLIDTFLVRTLMVPAVVVICGRRNWWPSKLGRPGVTRPDVAGKPRPAGARA